MTQSNSQQRENNSQPWLARWSRRKATLELKKSIYLALALCVYVAGGSNLSHAQGPSNYVQDDSTDLGDHTVNYTVFNSQFIPADIAAIHQLVRAKDRALINVSVINKQTGKTVSAKVSGVAKNLIQQSKSLTFKTIKEPDAEYYIAPVRHTNEEIFHFILSVTLNGTTHPIKFTRKLYVEG